MMTVLMCLSSVKLVQTSLIISDVQRCAVVHGLRKFRLDLVMLWPGPYRKEEGRLFKIVQDQNRQAEPAEA